MDKPIEPRIIELLKVKQPQTLSELSRILGVALPVLCIHVKELENKGLVRKETPIKNMLLKHIFLTAKGTTA